MHSHRQEKTQSNLNIAGSSANTRYVFDPGYVINHSFVVQLFQRRRETAKLYSPLRKHIDVLDALGVDGMSSDESSFDSHTSQPTYTIVKPSWRHPDLHHWLKVFDQLHHRNHVNSWSLDKRGAFTHIRAGSQKIRQTVHAPSYLPVNAYDPRWLESRESLYVRHVLCPEEGSYVFNHPPDVIAYVSPNHLNETLV